MEREWRLLWNFHSTGNYCSRNLPSCQNDWTDPTRYFSAVLEIFSHHSILSLTLAPKGKPRKQLAAMGLWCYPSPLDVMLVLMQMPTMLSYIFQLHHAHFRCLPGYFSTYPNFLVYILSWAFREMHESCIQIVFLWNF